ncbi:MAG: TolC family protein [Thiotrichales bacterium]
MRISRAVLVLTLPVAAWAQMPISETEAIRLSLAREGLAELEQGVMQAAEAEVTAAAQWPNPTLSYNRERTDGAFDTVEQSLVLGQTFDISGRRGLRRDAADRRIDIAGAELAARRIELSGEVRRAFHELLFRQENVRAVETWLGHFERMEDLVDKLVRAGEASGYDRRRLARERREIEAQLATERAERERERARLSALAGAGADPEVTGELLPSAPPAVEQALARLKDRPDLVALGYRADAAALEHRAAKRGAIPDISLGIGPKSVDNGIATDDGLVLSISAPLPIFDRNQADRQRAAAEALQARGEYRLDLAHAEGELRGLHRQADGLREAALDYRAEAVAATPELLRIAESAYAGGESSVLELLDAYRGALNVAINANELDKRARDARIEFDLLTGSVQ